MTLRPYKFQIVAICQELDTGERVLGERPVTDANGHPIEVFGIEGLAEFAATFEASLKLAQDAPTTDVKAPAAPAGRARRGPKRARR